MRTKNSFGPRVGRAASQTTVDAIHTPRSPPRDASGRASTGLCARRDAGGSAGAGPVCARRAAGGSAGAGPVCARRGPGCSSQGQTDAATVATARPHARCVSSAPAPISRIEGRGRAKGRGPRARDIAGPAGGRQPQSARHQPHGAPRAHLPGPDDGGAQGLEVHRGGRCER